MTGVLHAQIGQSQGISPAVRDQAWLREDARRTTDCDKTENASLSYRRTDS